MCHRNEVTMIRAAYCIKEICTATSLSRASIYRAIARGELEAIKHGRRTLIRAEALDRFLSHLAPTRSFQPGKAGK